jgi:hypothetical protein
MTDKPDSMQTLLRDVAGAIKAVSPTAVFSEPQPGRNFNRNQEDIDLVVAWRQGDKTRLVLIEAKGVTHFNNKQYASKIKRLAFIFGTDGTKVAGVIPSLVLTSPNSPKKVDASVTPDWGKDTEKRPLWLQLYFGDGLVGIRRVPSKSGGPLDQWKVFKRTTVQQSRP